MNRSIVRATLAGLMLCGVALGAARATWEVVSFTGEGTKFAGELTMNEAKEAADFKLVKIGDQYGVARLLGEDQWVIAIGSGEGGLLMMTEDGPLLNGSITSFKGETGELAMRKFPTSSGLYQIESASNDNAGGQAGGSLRLELAKAKLEGSPATYEADFGAEGQQLAGVAFDAPPFKIVAYGKSPVRLMRLTITGTSIAGGWIGNKNTSGTIMLTQK